MQPVALDVGLSALEAQELRSLTWGFVDQSLSEAEAEDAIATGLGGRQIDESPPDVLDALVDMKLVRVIREGGVRRYRTRIAELTRLLLRSRQWFSGQPWQGAPTLVSDFRIDIRPRRYPRRHIDPEVGLERLDFANRLSALQRNVWTALAGGNRARVLADFQLDSIQRLMTSDRGSGTIITAGTGSGKTLAFYLPALLRIAPDIREGEWWTKVLCLYPRQELLKDQLSEAYSVALRAGDVLKNGGYRLFCVGSFFGPTPYEASVRAVTDAGWKSRGNDFICPYVRCPQCSSDMLWSSDDLRLEREVLRCTDAACGVVTPAGSLRLTRKSVQRQPPDLLFSTTEMMNQRISDTRSRHIFGVGQPVARMPTLVLLDEVHTYSGISGAQTALLLRRWSALQSAKMRWVGLSATLPGPAQFFSDLTGIWTDHVAVVAPALKDLIEEGAEYQIILRSDPASQAATLSGSIQAVMLLARMLDRESVGLSGGRFGSKAFVFTDDLDVTHRLFDNLLDAEAYTAWRRPDPARVPLASLRASAGPDAVAREREGQRWQMAEELQGQLANRLVIGRTTSRDPGVDAAANVIVATSSLEVGFNDPAVGAVFQHKAPRSAASYVQRRGRAGRSRAMRPLTVLMLSDYGRDRAAFQSYEQLFDPTVEIANLPVRNLYVLRMQAVYSIFDWIASQCPRGTEGWSWRELSGPDNERRNPAFRDHAKRLLQSILQFDELVLGRLRTHLQSSLNVDNATLDNILWHPPRSILLEALPTLARRLFKDWVLAAGAGTDLHRSNPPHPLPDFVPANLFSDLNLPEVQIALPPPAQDVEAMPILTALQQFAPGRVRRRFADTAGNVSHWIPLDWRTQIQNVRIAAYAPIHEVVGAFNGVRDGSPYTFDVYRPWQLQLAVVPRSVSITSNSHWQWQSEFDALGDPSFVDLPAIAGVDRTVSRLELRLHRFGSGMAVRRFAHAGSASLKMNGRDQLIEFRIVGSDDCPAAVGFSFEADAIIADVKLPSVEQLRNAEIDAPLKHWLRYLALKQRMGVAQELPATMNGFRRDWLHQITFLAGVVVAEKRRIALPAALQELFDRDNPADFLPYVEAITVGAFDTTVDEDTLPTGTTTGPTVLGANLQAHLLEPGVLRSLLQLTLRWGVVLSPADWEIWLAEVSSGTIAEAVHLACLTAAPKSASAESLTVDVVAGNNGHRVIVAETTLGGGGTLEALSEAFAAEPRAFVRALESACTPSDQEMAASALRRVMVLINEVPEIAAAIGELRAADETGRREAARRHFFSLLASRGIPVSKTLSVLLATRLIRPGADASSDRLTLDLIEAWEALENKHGLSLPMRIAVPAVLMTSRLSAGLAALGGAGNEVLTAQSLLWPSGGELRQKALQSYNPYRAEPFVDSALARLLLFDSRLATVEYGVPNWATATSEILARDGAVRLIVPQSERTWRTEIIRSLSVPVVSGFLHFYPMVEAVRALASGNITVDIVLRERV
jgi:hypothetical protein